MYKQLTFSPNDANVLATAIIAHIVRRARLGQSEAVDYLRSSRFDKLAHIALLDPDSFRTSLTTHGVL